ncbi:AbrB family transcriptional regulator [Salipiger sp. H15]|uniref:AbrB family transcriptional regulator n=1 Tax=Alloyangia sp. H15 TaxID=3029062 RepID=A0AAU8ALQ0_9RHOB
MTRFDLGEALSALATLAVALAAGWVLSLTGLPLSWLLGAMLTMIVASPAKLPAVLPLPVMPWVRAAVGTMLGASISAGLWHQLGQWWVSLVIMFGVMALGGVINFTLLRRLFHLPRMDAALCAMPGGIAEMILLGEQAGADQRRVAITHALRIALSILIIPLLASLVFGITVSKASAGAPVQMTQHDWLWFLGCIVIGVAAGRWTRIPLGLMLVPLVISAVLHVSGTSGFHVPPAVSVIVQVMIGLNVGARFLGTSLRAVARVAAASVAVVAVQIALALGSAVLLSTFGGWDALALTLAYSPGGLAEMSLIAIAMGREVAFVTFHHILRVLFSLFLAPPLLKRLA